MTKRLTLFFALLFSVLLLSVTASAQGGLKPIADTGMIDLGPTEVLRLSVAGGDVTGDGNDIVVRFRQMSYIEQGNVYRVGSTNTSAPITLGRREATAIEIPNVGLPVRGVVLSNNRNVKVVAIVFDTSTQRINAIMTFIPD